LQGIVDRFISEQAGLSSPSWAQRVPAERPDDYLRNV